LAKPVKENLLRELTAIKSELDFTCVAAGLKLMFECTLRRALSITWIEAGTRCLLMR
jgi:hypothetical protein